MRLPQDEHMFFARVDIKETVKTRVKAAGVGE
jgi:hypothetical protein